MDGTTLLVPDTEDNAAAFGKPGDDRGAGALPPDPRSHRRGPAAGDGRLIPVQVVEQTLDRAPPTTPRRPRPHRPTAPPPTEVTVPDPTEERGMPQVVHCPEPDEGLRAGAARRHGNWSGERWTPYTPRGGDPGRSRTP
ncbi:hypothetical protein [Streptomyces sp. NK08204]|uniref:hypothetical protein n=1 Tax=Streptomyces sp. NK08204 TaxID=2873260 RepID=UPI001CECC543|nr:hypothetical protein [Streptomyces sp. NK08204]